PHSEEMWSFDFSTPTQSKTTIDPSDWKAGYYKMVIETQDSRGTPVTFQKVFTLYNTKQESIPANLAIWKSVPKTRLEPGENGQVFLASNGKAKYFLQEIEKSGKVVATKWHKVDGWLSIDNTIEEEDRGNIFYHLLTGYHNRAENWSQRIRVPYSNKKLNFEYSTFRSTLKPGQEEEWTIKISGPDKDIVQAEFIATLYDKSLDAFRANQWAFSPYLEYGYTQSEWNKNTYRTAANQARFQEYLDAKKRIEKVFPRIDINPFISIYGGYGDVPVAYSAAPQSARMETRSAAPASPKGYSNEEDSAEYAAPVSADAPPPPPPPGEAEEIFIVANTPSAPPQPLQIRKNLEETAFFFPNLYTDAEGNVVLKFKMKEALTSWKFLGFGHTKDLKYGITEQEIITQKELMISPNAPRFVRIGDQFSFTAKVSNLTELGMIGKATIDFLDANTLRSVNDQLGLSEAEIDFKVGPGRSRGLSWSVNIPDGNLDGLVYRVIAQSENYADGEEGMLPVLSNRILVTETMPLSVRQKETKAFDFAAMRSSLSSPTAKAHQFKLEYTSNPVWLAVQALPYLMEYPYDCSEQLFNRLYANTLASHIIDQNPSIKATFASWQGTDAMASNLSLNEELKAIILEETPWVRDAQSEEEQKARMALLFDLAKIQTEVATTIETLLARQSQDGGLPWFTGGRDNSYISSYLLAGFGHLESLGAMDIDENNRVSRLTAGLIQFVDQSILEAYEKLLESVDKGYTKLEDDHLSRMVIQYLYARSFYLETPFASEAVETAVRYYKSQVQKYWTNRGLQQQAQLGLLSKRMEIAEVPGLIYKSLSERAINSEELGMYWDYNTGFYWYQAPIETHALMVEFFNAMEDYKAVDELKIWLLKNKQTNSWKTTKATAEAIFALLQTTDGAALLAESDLAEIQFPELKKKDYALKLETAQADAQAGTGYFTSTWDAEEVQSELSAVKVKNNNKVVSWGAAYFQYFEDLDAVKTFEDTPLKLSKRLYKQVIGENGPELLPINENSKLQAGDLIKVRIELSVDRDMEFVHLKDMRASGLEPVNVLSSYKWQGGLGYYETTKDVATHFFMDYLPKGDYVFEYPLQVQLAGTFSNGISTIQSMYAPEFRSHSEGMILKIEE
ncbi:MAG: alpha-2-macroglobulin family protein, partial [Bacteroidota bacterium]